MKHDPRQFKELPAPLPAGERVLWQGKPSFKGLALRSFHIREVCAYFALLLVWRLWSSWYQGVSAADAVQAALLLVVPAAIGVAVLAALAWSFRRATCYTITTKRILFQFGVALPMTMNVPLSKIAGAALRTYADGSGDIPLRVSESKRVSYMLLWPHVRPWRLNVAEPMLNSIPDAAVVATKLSEALAGQPGPSTLALAQPSRADFGFDAAAHAPHTIAA